MVIVGGDALALRVCEELQEHGLRVVLVWRADAPFEARVAASGAGYVVGRPDDAETLHAAGIASASALMSLTDDDHLNLQVALRARDLNPNVRLVMRQFNRTLGRKIEQNLDDCSVISLSSHSAATYASRALDRECFYGVQFPDIDGPLAGFAERVAAGCGVAGSTVSDAERRLGERIIALDGDANVDATQVLDPACVLTTFGCVVARGRDARSGFVRGLPLANPRRIVDRLRKAVAHLDPVVRRVLLVGATFFIAGTAYASYALHLGWLTAMYFTVTTMTTTGYGDIVPSPGDVRGELAAMALMVGGLIFSGIFIAILTTRLTQAQFVATQGLRPVRRRGHIVVAGAGNVGSRVIEFLLRFHRRVVVVEAAPRPQIVELARDRKIELLTGDATLDSTLDLCNIAEAEAVVALTHSDSHNLGIALGARARNPGVPVVMRVQEQSFEQSVRSHFGFTRVHGTAALAAPVFAGLSREAGVRGRIELGALEHAVAEHFHEHRVDPPPDDLCIPLAAWRDGAFVALADFADVRVRDRVLFLYPVWRYRIAARGDRDGSVARTT